MKANKGTPYKKTCTTRFSHNQDRTSIAHTDEHLNLTKFYELQRISVSSGTRWSIVNIENTWRMHDIWELYWQKMYKYSVLHDRSASAQFSSCQMTFSWNKLYTKEIKITVIFGEKLHHKWHGKWKFCWKNMYCYIKMFWENTYWCSLSLRILHGTISSKHAVTNWEVYKCTLLIMSNWLFILNWLYTKEQNVSDFHYINVICYTDGFIDHANWKKKKYTFRHFLTLMRKPQTLQIQWKFHGKHQMFQMAQHTHIC